MPLDLNELRELLTALNQTDIAELTLKSDDFELTVRRGIRGGVLPLADPSQIEIAPPSGLPPASVAPAVMPTGEMAERSPVISTAPPPPTHDRRWVEITSPMVGTFYRAPAPDEPPFVDVGDRVRVGQTVCIIEAMKLMNELESEVTGEIMEILVENGQPVEYGQPLMRVNPG